VKTLPWLGLLAVVSISAACVPYDPSTRAGAAKTALSPGQHALVFERREAKGGAVNYLLYLPEGYNVGAQRWPLILYLHGRSLRGDDPQRLKAYGLPRLLEKDKAFPFIVVSPQCRDEERWTDLDTLLALLDDVSARAPVDPERVYLTGFSMGGGGAWRLAEARPERFAAVAPLAGMGDPKSVGGLKRVPVWAFHGSKDESTPVEESTKMVEALQAAGGNVKLEILPERGHDIADVYERKDLYDWFLQHKKQPGEKDPFVGPKKETP
jgi:predicted peptidase